MEPTDERVCAGSKVEGDLLRLPLLVFTVNVCAVEPTFATMIAVVFFTVSVVGANTRAPFAPCSSVVPPPPAADEVTEHDEDDDELHATPTSPRTNYSITTTNFHFAIWDTFDLP
jgi:hypothetical protein